MTFISLSQPRIFLCSIFIGIIVGFYYEIYYFISLFFKKNFIKHGLKILWLLTSSIIYTSLSFAFEFPNVREYMFLGVIVGCLLYKFSFHKVIAILLNRVYNIIKVTIIKLKKRFLDTYERRKEKKGVLCDTSGANNVYHDIGGNISLPTCRNTYSQKQNRKTRRGNNRFKARNFSNGRRDRRLV
ncbi:MAG: hypothetical protein E7358_06335 [Clostridiales bacterium]|nr:hypothetical protein [Clostridiales bacterium]